MQYYRRDFKAMGTPCDIQVFARNSAAAERTFAAVVGDVQRLEALYSRYRDDSFLSAINRAAREGGSIRVDNETACLLDYATACFEQSEGLFDITSGILRRAWDFKQNRLPEPGAIESLLDKIGWQKVRWMRPELAFPVPGMELDFGGVVKEYAADRAAALCREQGVRHGLINLGGDIKVVGPRVDGSPWRIGIRHPRNTDGLLDSLQLYEGALTSSGDYERCISIDGVRYGHVLNPVSGWPVRHLAAVSVVADFCVVAGSASTIAMLKETQGPDWLKNLGLPHLWVDVEGRIGGTLVDTDAAASDG